MFDAILLDLDGTLIDSLPLYFESGQVALAPYNVTITADLWRQAVSEFWSVRDWYQRFDLQTNFDELHNKWIATYEHLRDTKLRTKPGAFELLCKLKQSKIPMSLVTHSRHDEINPILNQLNWSDFFGQIVSSEDVRWGKPHPDSYLLAAKLLQKEPGRCLVIEDAPGGLEAAKAAGMNCVVCPDAFMGFAKSEFAAADAMVGSLTDVDIGFLVDLHDSLLKPDQ